MLFEYVTSVYLRLIKRVILILILDVVTVSDYSKYINGEVGGINAIPTPAVVKITPLFKGMKMTPAYKAARSKKNG